MEGQLSIISELHCTKISLGSPVRQLIKEASRAESLNIGLYNVVACISSDQPLEQPVLWRRAGAETQETKLSIPAICMHHVRSVIRLHLNGV